MSNSNETDEAASYTLVSLGKIDQINLRRNCHFKIGLVKITQIRKSANNNVQTEGLRATHHCNHQHPLKPIAFIHPSVHPINAPPPNDTKQIQQARNTYMYFSHSFRSDNNSLLHMHRLI
jgi:hypothetical protein